jgi:hypothetical protein
VAYFQLIGTGNKFSAIPETGRRSYGGEIYNERNQKGCPASDKVPCFEFHDFF